MTSPLPISSSQAYLLTPLWRPDPHPAICRVWAGHWFWPPYWSPPCCLPEPSPLGLGPRTSLNQPLFSTLRPTKSKDSSTFPCTLPFPLEWAKNLWSCSSSIRLFLLMSLLPSGDLQGVIYPDRLGSPQCKHCRSINKPKTQLAFNYSGFSQILMGIWVKNVSGHIGALPGW